MKFRNLLYGGLAAGTLAVGTFLYGYFNREVTTVENLQNQRPTLPYIQIEHISPKQKKAEIEKFTKTDLYINTQKKFDNPIFNLEDVLDVTDNQNTGNLEFAVALSKINDGYMLNCFLKIEDYDKGEYFPSIFFMDSNGAVLDFTELLREEYHKVGKGDIYDLLSAKILPGTNLTNLNGKFHFSFRDFRERTYLDTGFIFKNDKLFGTYSIEGELKRKSVKGNGADV